MKDSENSNMKDYFFEMKQLFEEKYDLNTLTGLLSKNDFSEIKPYLTRRKLIPKDSRFKSIELVYETPDLVRKMCWDLNIRLSSLIQYFGRPRFHYAPHGSATMIGFFELDNQFSGFETIHPGEVKENNGKYEIITEDYLKEIKDDLELSFVSFDIERMKNK